MNQLIQKILDTGKTEALKSSDALQKAAAELGFGAAEVAAAMDDFDGFPLSDDDLIEISAGTMPKPPKETPFLLIPNPL